MKKLVQIGCAILVMVLGVSSAFAQGVSQSYTFSQSTQQYVEEVGNLPINDPTDDDDVYPQQLIGFPFQYNGKFYDTVAVGNNGFIIFHSGSTPTTSGLNSSISGPGASGGSSLYNFKILTSSFQYGPIYAGFNMDLHVRDNGQLTVNRSGSAPNRKTVFQWKSYQRYSTSTTGTDFDSVNFQIVLNESDYSISTVFGTMKFVTGTNPGAAQIGLRGNDTTDINSRAGTDFSASTQSLYARDYLYVDGRTAIPSGLTYTWRYVPPAPIDASIVSILKPTSSAGTTCVNSASDSVTFVLKNNGLDSLTSVPVSYSINNGPVVTQTFTFNPPLKSKKNATLAFNTLATLSGSSVFIVKVFSTLQGETLAGARNDTATKTITFNGTNSLTVHPYWLSDFGGRITTGNPAGWVNTQISGTLKWSVDSVFFNANANSQTLLSNLGPIFLAFNANANNSTGAIARLSTPCLSLTNWPTGESCYLHFGMAHDNGAPNRNDNLQVEVTTDGVNFTSLGTFARYDVNAVTPFWTQHSVDLSAYKGQTIRVGLLATSAGGNNFALDYLSITNTITSTGRNLAQTSVKVYPNPTSGLVNVELPKNMEFSNISIINTLGQTVLTVDPKTVVDGNLSVNIASLPRGTYQLSVSSATNRFLHNVVKQ